MNCILNADRYCFARKGLIFAIIPTAERKIDQCIVEITVVAMCFHRLSVSNFFSNASMFVRS